MMPVNFHERYTESDIQPPYERSTGLGLASVTLIVALIWRNSTLVPWIALAIGLCLGLVSLIAPVLLKPLNIFWFRLGLLLQRVVNPIVMFSLFMAVFVPAGVI